MSGALGQQHTGLHSLLIYLLVFALGALVGYVIAKRK